MATGNIIAVYVNAKDKKALAEKATARGFSSLSQFMRVAAFTAK